MRPLDAYDSERKLSRDGGYIYLNVSLAGLDIRAVFDAAPRKALVETKQETTTDRFRFD